MRINFTPHRIKAAKAYLETLTLQEEKEEQKKEPQRPTIPSSPSEEAIISPPTSVSSPSLLQRFLGLFRRHS